jgi:hypothetical protein
MHMTPRFTLQDLSENAKDLDITQWEHRYHTVQVDMQEHIKNGMLQQA